MAKPILIDGRKQARLIKDSLIPAVQLLKDSHAVIPQLAIIQVGNHAASTVYVQAKLKECQAMGIQASLFHLKDTVDQSALQHLIIDLNNNAMVHGIIVQLPLPSHINDLEIIRSVDWRKDVDGLHPINQGMLLSGDFRKDFQAMIPCTPLGCLSLLTADGSVCQKQAFDQTDANCQDNTQVNTAGDATWNQAAQANQIKDDRIDCDIVSDDDNRNPFSGQRIAIIGSSKLVGLPLGIILLRHGYTVTFINRSTVNPQDITAKADIIIAAAGSPNLVKSHWVKKGATIIDVGITRVNHPDGHTTLVGDVDFESLKNIDCKMTPVPGGVGPMTIAFLMTNTVFAAYNAVGLTFPHNPVTQIFQTLSTKA